MRVVAREGRQRPESVDGALVLHFAARASDSTLLANAAQLTCGVNG